MSSQSLEQALQQGSVQVTEGRDELSVKLTNGSFKITEGMNPNDRFYEMRHWRASTFRFQDDGSLILVARNSTLAPNLGFFDIRSTGYTHITSEHNIVIASTGHAKTGGGEAGSADNKGLELKSTGDLHIQSDGKGGIYVSSASNIEFRCPGNMIFNAGGQISMNTGAKSDISAGLSKGIGSGKFTVSTGSYELATTTYKETVTGSKREVNNGEIETKQEISLTEPSLPNSHIITTETQGSLVQKVGHDYILEVDGKMLLRVNNNPLKKGGALQGGSPLYPVQTTEALKQEVVGTRATYIKPSATPPYGADYTEIELGHQCTKIKKAAPAKTAWSVASNTMGDLVMQTTAVGNIGIKAGPTPSNAILLQNEGGSVRIEANGAMGMIQMLATKEIRARAIRINLNG